MFPAEQLGCHVVKAWRAVIAAGSAAGAGRWDHAGQHGSVPECRRERFGLGSALYKPGQSAAVTASHAKAFINGLRIARAGAKK